MEPQQLEQVQQIVGELRTAQQELQRAARGGGPGGNGVRVVPAARQSRRRRRPPPKPRTPLPRQQPRRRP
jgi:hypothetical protein